MQSQTDQNPGRPFICPCGKSYLSYPALFTHVKHKHDGTPPGEIIRPKPNNKRGRPRKTLNGQSQEEGSHQNGAEVSGISEHKKVTDWYYNTKNNDEDYQNLLKETQLFRKKLIINQEYKAPIKLPQSINSSFKCYKAPLLLDKNAEKPDNNLKQLQKRLIYAFKNYSQLHNLGEQKIDSLLQANISYQKARREPRGQKQLIGIDQWQVDLRTGCLQFLDWCQPFLSKQQYKNIELLIGLMVVFYKEMLPQYITTTTSNYVLYLNLFTKNLIKDVQVDPLYGTAYCLSKQHPIVIISILHEWLNLNGLSYYEVKINSSFLEEQHAKLQAAFIPPIRTIDL